MASSRGPRSTVRFSQCGQMSNAAQAYEIAAADAPRHLTSVPFLTISPMHQESFDLLTARDTTTALGGFAAHRVAEEE